MLEGMMEYAAEKNMGDIQSVVGDGFEFVMDSWQKKLSQIYLPKAIHIFTEKSVRKVVCEKKEIFYKNVKELCLIASTTYQQYKHEKSLLDIGDEHIFLFEGEKITRRRIITRGEHCQDEAELMFAVGEREDINDESMAIKNYGKIKVGKHGGVYCQIEKKIYMHQHWMHGEENDDKDGNKANQLILRLLLLEKMEKEVKK